ncbi:LysR family transcriptional regulator [Amaricoccus tamworthensis]|uniref:LysR family transcriptional regulator n=1 Tax=Amaricoccus tamworthensis TaxID=57002 RepID=UPI003C7A0233
MIRNLDITALRSFVAVADSGGVTRAATMLNLTQSAVSMQLKRLEETFGQSLFDRTGRGIALTASGEQLLGYARKLVAMNDETWGLMTNQAFEGEISFGVPHDLIYPHMPAVMQRFAVEFPRVRIQLHSLYSTILKEKLRRGDMDLILATEETTDPGGEVLASDRLVWVGAKNGQAWRQRPLRFAAVNHCIFRRVAVDALARSDIQWESGIDAISDSAVNAGVQADLAINVQLPSAVPPECEIVADNGALPELPVFHVNMYIGNTPRSVLAEHLARYVRQAYCHSDVMAAE